MSTTKVAISIDSQLLGRLDALVKNKTFANRRQAIQQAVEEKIARLEHSRLARECSKLDPSPEKTIADESLARDLAEWPEY